MKYKGTPWDSKFIDGKFYKFDTNGEINIGEEVVETLEPELEKTTEEIPDEEVPETEEGETEELVETEVVSPEQVVEEVKPKSKKKK